MTLPPSPLDGLATSSWDSAAPSATEYVSGMAGLSATQLVACLAVFLVVALVSRLRSPSRRGRGGGTPVGSPAVRRRALPRSGVSSPAASTSYYHQHRRPLGWTRPASADAHADHNSPGLWHRGAVCATPLPQRASPPASPSASPSTATRMAGTARRSPAAMPTRRRASLLTGDTPVRGSLGGMASTRQRVSLTSSWTPQTLGTAAAARRPAAGGGGKRDQATSLLRTLTVPRSLSSGPGASGRTRHLLVLDIDETLVHSTLKGSAQCDLTIPVVIDGVHVRFFVHLRPHVRHFLASVCQWFDVAVFTAGLSQYAGPLMDHLDPGRMIKRRLFRDSCLHVNGQFVKNLCYLSHEMHRTFIIDNSPTVYQMYPENAIPIESWFGRHDDVELLSLLPVLKHLADVEDVRPHILSHRSSSRALSG